MKRASNPSVAVTEGVRVTVRSQYLPRQSSPREGRFAFAYTVTLENEGDLPAALRSRHWIITDATGHVEEVRGLGVVGEFPHLEPGESFQYTSGCVLKTQSGFMYGSYQMVRPDGRVFDAEIAPFMLAMPHSIN